MLERALMLATTLALASCGTTNISTPALWADLEAANQASDTRQIMLIEAELASRGATQYGAAYIRQKTAGTVGKRSYSRSQAASGGKKCSDFPTSAAAQKFFLANDGPISDPYGLDKDGDGNACEWGTTLRSSVASYHRAQAQTRTTPRRVASYSRCYIGPRGGTYTITAGGRRNYGGC